MHIFKNVKIAFQSSLLNLFSKTTVTVEKVLYQIIDKLRMIDHNDILRQDLENMYWIDQEAYYSKSYFNTQ